MNDLEVYARDLMGKVFSAVTAEDVRAACPMGHTEFQVRNAVLNRQEYPAGLPRFRQALREMITRYEAYWQNRDRAEDLAIERRLAEAEIVRLKRSWTFTSWGRAKRDAMLDSMAQKIKRIDRITTFLNLDLEHRIIRESLVLMEEAKAARPENMSGACSVEEEEKYWKARQKQSGGGNT